MLKIYGNLDGKFISDAFSKLSELIDVPENLEVYFLDKVDDCEKLNLPRRTIEMFKNNIRKGKTSFSYAHNERKIVLMLVNKNSEYLVKNKKALIGLLLHEVKHAIQANRRLYTHVSKNMMKALIENLQGRKLSRIEEKVLIRTGFSAALFLKDVYANIELIRNGLADYLLENYMAEFNSRKTCPIPVFYDDLKKDLKKNPLLLHDLFLFQFALLSILIPFEKTNNSRAIKLKRHIERCYQAKIKDIVESFSDVRELMFNIDSENDDFQMMFFKMILAKVLAFLSNSKDIKRK